MADFQVFFLSINEAKIAFIAPNGQENSQRPAVVFLHGALRNSRALVHWVDRLADAADVFLIDLPGHGESAHDGPSTVEGLGKMMHDVINYRLRGRNVLLVGESLGGAVALAAGGAKKSVIKGIVAIDPPLTTAKLWHVQLNFTPFMNNLDLPYIHRLGRDVFGIKADDAVEERIYYPLIGNLQVPSTIITGDLPLMPARNMRGIACLIDDVDRFVIGQLYSDKTEIVDVPDCGHLLLADAQDACEAVIRRKISDILGQISRQ